MPNLFLIDGVSGSSKSEFMDHCEGLAPNDNKFIAKYTTKLKSKESYERRDLKYVSDDEYKSLRTGEFFEYFYPEKDGTNKRTAYLLKKEELDDYLRHYKNVFVIIRNTNTIMKIKEAYANCLNINVVTVFVYCDNEKLKIRTKDQIIKEKKYTEKELEQEKVKEEIDEAINSRLKRNDECLKSYIDSLKSMDLRYDYVILNDLDIVQYKTCIDDIMSKYADFDKKFETLSAFVIMPMPNNKEGAHFFKVKEAIYAGAQKAGFSALRQDDNVYSQDTIYSEIKKSIEDAIVCIVDLTNSRPNCYFEAGMAFSKAKGKIPTAFLIAEKGSQIEFDLSGISHAEYIYSANNYSDVESVVEKLLKDFRKKHIFETCF